MNKIYKREKYLKKIHGYYNDDMIKVILGIKGCGKSYLLKSVIEELLESGANYLISKNCSFFKCCLSDKK